MFMPTPSLHPNFDIESTSTMSTTNVTTTIDITLNLSAKPGFHELLNEPPMSQGFNHLMYDFSQFEALLDSLPTSNVPLVTVPKYFTAPFTAGWIENYCQHEFVPSYIEWNTDRNLRPQTTAHDLYSTQLSVRTFFFHPFIYFFVCLKKFVLSLDVEFF